MKKNLLKMITLVLALVLMTGLPAARATVRPSVSRTSARSLRQLITASITIARFCRATGVRWTQSCRVRALPSVMPCAST